MARILILIILIWVLYLIIRRIGRVYSKPSAKTEQKLEEKIVQCGYCGCHVPETESQIKNNKITCNNPECQILANQENPHGD